MKRTAAALSILFAAALGGAACTIPEPENVCTDVDCSGHGECTIYTDFNGDQPHCICEAGYMRTVDGTGCYQLIPPDAGPDADQ